MPAEINNTGFKNDPNLVTYLRLEGNSNDSKDSNNGTDVSITYSTANGKFGQGAGFDGSASKITLNNAANLQITGALTIVSWWKPNDPPGTLTANGVIKGDNLQNSDFDYSLQPDGRKVVMFVSNGVSASHATGSTQMSDANWHMVAGVYVPSTSVTVYLDGIQDAQSTSSIIASIQSTTHQVFIGKNGTGVSFYKGAMDEIAIFNKALSANEIFRLYKGPVFGGII